MTETEKRHMMIQAMLEEHFMCHAVVAFDASGTRYAYIRAADDMQVCGLRQALRDQLEEWDEEIAAEAFTVTAEEDTDT